MAYFRSVFGGFVLIWGLLFGLGAWFIWGKSNGEPLNFSSPGRTAVSVDFLYCLTILAAHVLARALAPRSLRAVSNFMLVPVASSVLACAYHVLTRQAVTPNGEFNLLSLWGYAAVSASSLWIRRLCLEQLRLGRRW